MSTRKTIIVLFTLIAPFVIVGQTLNDAVKQTNNEQFETADASFKKLLQDNTAKGEVYFYYGENFFKNNDLESAKETYQKGITANAENPLCYVGLGKVAWYNKNESEANAMFYKAKTLANKKDETPLLKIAEAYINAEVKDLDKALELINKAIEINPENPDAYILKGDVFLEKNDGTKSIQNYDKASSLDEKLTSAIIRQAKVYWRARNYNLALQLYKKANDIDSTFAPAYREKAEIYFLAGQYKNASEQYEKYLQLNDNCSARERYAGFLNQAKKYEESIVQSDMAMKCNPSNPYLYRYKGYSQYEIGDYENGLKTLTAFFEMVEKTGKAKLISQDYEYRALLYSKLNSDSTLMNAIADFNKALELDPLNTKLRDEIAKLYIKMKMYPEAIAEYKAVIETGEANANHYFGLGRAYYYSQNFAAADSAFLQITISNPSLALGYLWRAKASIQMDSNNEQWLAKPFYEQAIERMKPTDNSLIEANLYLGVYYINQKEICLAKPYFEKIKELDASHSEAIKFFKSPEVAKCQ